MAPIIHKVQKAHFTHDPRRFYQNKHQILALVISPTRELAEQLAAEARKFTYGTGVRVQTAVGGSLKRKGLAMIQDKGCNVLIGTPGRLNDVLSMPPGTGVDAPDLKMLVLDEADQLLDQGFWPEVQSVMKYLPSGESDGRQTVMFSATAPNEIMRVVREALKRDYKFIKTISDTEPPTHLKVPQKVVWLNGFENSLSSVLDILKGYVRNGHDAPPLKAIVYFNSGREVEMATELFSILQFDNPELLGGPHISIVGLHSRLTQAQRTANANKFRKAQSSVLFSTDLTARGMDFPDVTHVIQVGIPKDRDTYIHRVGRTGRMDKSGEGWLLISDADHKYERRLKGLPLEEATTETSNVDIPEMQEEGQLGGKNPSFESIDEVNSAMEMLPQVVKYLAFTTLSGVLASRNTNKVECLRILQRVALYGYRFSKMPPLSDYAKNMLGLVPEGSAREMKTTPRANRKYATSWYRFQ